MKSGFRTTEFWLSLLGILGNIYLQSKTQDPIHSAAGLVGAGIASAGYAVSRGLAKTKRSIAYPSTMSSVE